MPTDLLQDNVEDSYICSITSGREYEFLITFYSIDLAVGAPFMAANEGSGTGAVYIYMGSSSGLEKDPFQVICMWM